jgi:4-amino-4-deoxy-L-arabinose transferase-like glycosyltransferase
MNQYLSDNSIFFLLILTLLTIPWKVYAVWLAVKRNQRKWFVALLLLNTVGILEIFYIFKIANKKWVEVKKDFSKAWKSIK